VKLQLASYTMKMMNVWYQGIGQGKSPTCMKIKQASDLVGPQVEASTRYLFIAGLSVVMFLEFDVDSSSDVSSIAEVAKRQVHAWLF